MFQKKVKLVLFPIILSVLISGCVPSLVYSPSINLPPKPLNKNDFQILGGVVYLPETQPNRMEEKLAFGGEATFRYGFSNNYSMQFKSWYDLSNKMEEKRWGMSLGSIIVFNDSSNYRFGIMPNLAFAAFDNSIEGGGGYIPFIFWINNYDPINFYIAAGPVLGIRDITEENNEWGWGIILNVGSGIIINNITLNIEFSGIKQVNEYSGKEDYFFSPSINLGYIF